MKIIKLFQIIVFSFYLCFLAIPVQVFAGTDGLNNSPDTSIEIPLGQQLYTSIDYSSDHDWYKITVDHTCSLVNTVTNNSGTLSFRIYDNNLNKLSEAYIGVTSNGYTHSWKVNQGTYYIRVSEWSSIDYTISNIGLKVVIREEDQWENNDSSQNATIINPGNQISGIAIEAINDADWFKVTVDHACSIVSTITNNSGGIRSRIYDENLKELSNAYIGVTSSGYKQSWNATPGIYYIRLSNWTGINHIDSTITLNVITENDLAYKLSLNASLGRQIWCFLFGDPVNVTTGNFTLENTDVSIPTQGVSLKFTRSYNSRDGHMGQMGKGWQHNYNSLLTFNTDNSISVYYPDGHSNLFAANTDGSYTPQAGCFETLSKNIDETFTLTFKNQTKYIYNAQGKLTKINDKNNNIINLDYNESLLTRVTEPAGRSLTLTYNADNRLSQITDPAGRTVDFTYYVDGNLATVKDIKGGITTYSYVTQGLASITDPGGHVTVKNIYDSNSRVIQQEDAKGNITKFSYDPVNRKNTITDPRGFITEVYYDDKFRVTKMVYPENKTEEFTYDNNYNRTSYKDKNGNTTTYTYDNVGNLLTKKDPDPLGYTTTFTYDSLNNPTKIVDAAGYTTSFTYDPKGNLLSLSKGTEGQTATTSFTYNDFGQVSTITNANGKTPSISYDQYGNKASETNPLGQTTSYTFDNLGRKLSQTDPRGNTWSYTYNAAGNLLTVTDPLGRVITNTYDANNNLTSTTDAKGKTTTFMYDENNNLTETTDPLGNSTNYTYDASNNRKSITDTNGHTTAFEYDFLERLTSTTYPDGTSETLTLDGNGNIIAKTDRKGNTTQYEYDVLNRLTKVTNPMGGTISNQYDSLNNKTKVTDQRGNSTTFTYDHESRLLTITDPLNNSTSYTYDLVGNKLSVTNAKGATWNYVYDDASRLIKTTDPLGHDSLVDYDQAGNVVATTDANGKSTSFTYNALNKIESVTDALGNKTEYAYDENNNLVKVTNARGYATTFAYDELNRQVEVKNPLGHSKQYSYDPVGNLARKIMADGSTIQYEYDSNNRLKEINYPDMNRVAFGYDNNGNRTYMNDSSGSTSYLYDNLNRLTSVTRSVYGNDCEIQYAYDAASNLTGFTYPNGLLVTYGYDELNRMTSVTDAVYGMTISYDELGNKTQENRPNGITVNYQYDDNGRLLSMEHAKGPDILTKSEYILDHVGNRLTKTNEQGKTITYIYDNLYQLTRVQYPDNNVSEYAYDAVGNRISADGVNYTYDEANRLIQVGSTPYGYDLNGNLISVEDAVYYNYDYENRLILFDNGTDSFRYTYDGDGMRASQSVTGEVYGSTEYFYDVNAGLPRLIMEKGTGDNITNYLYGGSLYSLINPSGQFFYHADGLGSISVITDVYGSPVNRYEYDAFGVPLMTEESIANPFRFTGEPFDPSGMIYLRARYYDPSIGRFLTQDTVFGEINTPLSQNLYAYCGNNPVVFVDPSGHIRICWEDAWESTKKNAIYAGNLANELVTPDLNNPVDVFFFELEKSAPFPAAKAAGFAGIIGRKGITKTFNLIKGAGKVQAPQKVIGHYPEYVEMSSKLGTKPFSIPDNIWSKMTPSEQWAANQKFLDRAIAKGSEFNLATPIDKVRPDSFLQREIEYLTSQGYKLSNDGTKLVK